VSVRGNAPVWLAAILVLVGGVVALKGFDPYDEGVWGAMATHLMQARSLAYDGDLRYAKRDIDRWFENPTVEEGPRGLYLKRTADGYHYASPFLYALVSAPFVRVLGDRGLLVVNVVLLAVIVWMLAGWWRRAAGPWRAAVFALAVVGFSLAPAYVFVMEPNLLWPALLGGGLILVLRAIERPEPRPASDSEAQGSSGAGARGVRWWRLILGALVLGLAVYERPLFALFAIGIVVAVVVTRGWKPLLVGALAMAAAWFAPTAVHLAQDGTISPYLGDRRQYVRGVYPLTERCEAFSAGRRDESVLADGGIRRRVRIVPGGDLRGTLAVGRANLPLNLRYFVVGRQAGLLAYAPGAVMCLLLFLLCRGRRKTLPILVAAVLYTLFYLLLRPNGYFGGGTSLGNRNVLHILPALALLAPTLPRPRRFVLALAPIVVLGVVFLNPVLLRPRFAVLGRFNRMKRPGLVWLPLELTQAPAMFSWPREVIPLPDGDRLYRLTGTRPSPTLGWVVAPNDTACFVLESRSPRKVVRLRIFIGPDRVEFLPLGVFARKGWSTGLPPGACKVVDFAVPRQRRIATQQGDRWAAEFGFRALVPRQWKSGIAAGLKPASPPEDFTLPGHTLNLGEPGDQRHLLWGWTGRLRDADGTTFRAADERWSFILVYLPPGRDYLLSLEGRSHVPLQRVVIDVNGRACGGGALSAAWGAVRCTIPAGALAGDVATIRLAHGRLTARSHPVSRAATPDEDARTRLLAADYRRITITPREAVNAGS